MFHRAAFVTICAVCILYASPARMRAQEGEVLVVQKGQAKSMSLDKLVGVTVGDVNVSYIASRKGDEFVIMGAGVGETTLTLTQRGGLKKIFTVRVVYDAAQAARSSEQRPRADAPPPRPTPTPRPGAAESADRPALVVDANSPAAAEPPPAPPAPARSSPGRRRPQLSLEAIYISDTERFPLLSVGAPHQHGADGHGEHAHADDEGGAHLHQDGTVTAKRSLIIFPLSLRFPLNHRDTISVSAPFVRRRDTLEFAGNTIRFANEGLGDIHVGFERVMPGFMETWDANWGLSARLPTGGSVYNLEEGKSPLGTGHYEVGGGFGVRRIFDPIVFRASVNLNYALPRKVGGVWFKPGMGHSVNTGIDYALSNRFTLSEQLSFTQRQNAFLVDPTASRTETTRQAYLGHSLFLKPKRGRHDFRFTFTLGLNNAAADYATSMTFTR